MKCDTVIWSVLTVPSLIMFLYLAVYYVTKMNYNAKFNYSVSGSGTAAGSASGNASYVHGYKHEGTYEKKVKGQK